jgi:hypothetical protein
MWIDGVSASLKRQHISGRVWLADVHMRYLPLGSTVCSTVLEMMNATEGSALWACREDIALVLKDLVDVNTMVPWTVLENVNVFERPGETSVVIYPRLSKEVQFCADEKANREVLGHLGCGTCPREWDIRLLADAFEEGELRNDDTDKNALLHLVQDMRTKGKGLQKDGCPVGVNGVMFSTSRVEKIVSQMRKDNPAK